MPITSIKILTFRYISKNVHQDFFNRLKVKWFSALEEYKNDIIINQSSDKLWIYPKFKPLNGELLKVRCERCLQIPYTLDFYLDQLEGIFIQDLPIHFKYVYSFCFIFSCREEFLNILNSEINSDNYDLEEIQKQILLKLKDAKIYINKYIDDLFENKTVSLDKNKNGYLGENYKPLIWQIDGTGYRFDLLNLIGNKNPIFSTKTNKTYIERGFPDCSYILYNQIFNYSYFSDLILVSLIVHQVERGYRKKIDKILQEIKNSNPINSIEISNIDKIKDNNILKEMLARYNRYSNVVSSKYEKLFKYQQKLINSEGLVKRINQKWGLNTSSQNMFDIICNDAIVVIKNELNSILEVTQSKLENINKTIEIITNYLKDNRNSNIQNKLIIIGIISAFFAFFNIFLTFFKFFPQSENFFEHTLQYLFFILIPLYIISIILNTKRKKVKKLRTEVLFKETYSLRKKCAQVLNNINRIKKKDRDKLKKKVKS